MLSNWGWFLILLSSLGSYGQTTVEFTVVTKVPPLSGTAVGSIKADNSIFLRDSEDYYHFSFETSRWNKLRFGKKLSRLSLWSSRSLNFGYSKVLRDNHTIDFSPITYQIPLSYLPTFSKVIIISDQIEMLDNETLEVSNLPIKDWNTIGGGTAVWQEKIYLFGGVNVSSGLTNQEFHKEKLEYSNQLIVFDPAKLSFQERASLPGPRLTQGVFINDMLYVIGVEKENKSVSDILRYDPSLDHWEHLGEIPHRIAAVAMASSGEFIYLLGTRDTKGFMGIYNTSTNQYTEHATNVKWTRGSACIHKNKLYYFAGVDIDFPKWVARPMYVLDLNMLPN